MQTPNRVGVNNSPQTVELQPKLRPAEPATVAITYTTLATGTREVRAVLKVLFRALSDYRAQMISRVLPCIDSPALSAELAEDLYVAPTMAKILGWATASHNLAGCLRSDNDLFMVPSVFCGEPVSDRQLLMRVCLHLTLLGDVISQRIIDPEPNYYRKLILAEALVMAESALTDDLRPHDDPITPLENQAWRLKKEWYLQQMKAPGRKPARRAPKQAPVKKPGKAGRRAASR